MLLLQLSNIKEINSKENKRSIIHSSEDESDHEAKKSRVNNSSKRVLLNSFY